MKKRLGIIGLIWAIASLAYGSSYYFCDFEDAAENAQWQLNTPKNDRFRWMNLWYIGNATSCDGEQSMYISTDYGATAGYIATSNIMIAWREFNSSDTISYALEPGEYDLAFDWRNVGDSARAGISVAWVPESQWATMICGMNDEIKGRDWLMDNLLTFDGQQILHNSSVWSHSITKLHVDGTPHRLVFVYRTSGIATVRNPGACVDNVQIARNNCGTPTDLQVQVNGAYTTFTWNSTAEAFNIRCVHQITQQVILSENLRTNKLVLPLEHGVYIVYIQTICNGEQSVWYAFPAVMVYDAKCFNYLDLRDEQCFYAANTAGDWHDNDKNLKPGKIDYGFLSDRSRHTIHYMKDEFDARTYNSYDSKGKPVAPLRTIPDGEIASVRIGSWEKSAHVARVAYEFDVDTEEAAVLMLKYAMVLQWAEHEETARPRFTLKIVDADTGEELSTCTTVDFSAATNGDGWYRSPAVSFNETNDQDVCWRDWTTVGLNLEDFDGTRVRIILTAYGCTASIHYGYAYFTLNCTSGHIEGINCGDTPTNEFVAPEGFDYRWYTVADSSTLSTERVFPVDYDDDTEYMVDVIYKTNDKCRFSLTACAIPRYPVPEATYEVFQKDCHNYIRFHNNSHVRTKNLRTGEIIEHSKYPVEFTVWNYGDLAAPSTEWEETIEVPAAGGRFPVTLSTSVGLCEETLTMNIDVPSIGPDSIVERHDLCEGEYFTYKGKTYRTDTVLVSHDINRYGCDSTFCLDLHFTPKVYTELSDTILDGTTYTWEIEGLDPLTFTAAGDYTKIISQHGNGCDSVLTLHLYVLPRLQVELTSVEMPCAGEQEAFDLAYTTNNGSIEQLTAMLGQQPMEVLEWTDIYARLSLPKDIVPGFYPLHVVCHNEALGDSEIETEVEVRYPAALIQQRWGDVLGILNEQYNGGYVFVAYQWYKDGQAVEQATSPYYYEAQGLAIETGYSAALLREGETRPVRTCDYWPVPFISADDNAQAAPRKYMQNGHLYIQVGERIYNACGTIK